MPPLIALPLDGHEVAEQRAHRGRELGLVVQVAGLTDGLGSRGVRVDHARQAAQAHLRLHRHGHLAGGRGLERECHS